MLVLVYLKLQAALDAQKNEWDSHLSGQGTRLQCGLLLLGLCELAIQDAADTPVILSSIDACWMSDDACTM